MITVARSKTFLDALVVAIQAASSYNRQDQTPAAAVLWPDEGRQWEGLLPLLRDRLPIFALGEYSPEERTGPAYWLRCIIARTIPHPGLPDGQTPVLYLPGYSRQRIRALEACPVELQPLAELQYRGVLWNQENGRDWTISAFLQKKDGGLGIAVGADQATKEALHRALIRLSREPVEALYEAAPLRAFFLDGLIHPDNVKNVLRWLDDPNGYRGESTDQEWEAFVALCGGHYDFDPDRDSPVTVAEKLGHRDGNWSTVWRRFAEAPASYSTIPDQLRQAKPEKTLPLLHHAESWPQDNETAERTLRDALVRLSSLDPDSARRAILELDLQHGERRNWVWASLGHTPMAKAIEHLATLAKATNKTGWGTSVSENVEGYAEKGGWAVDLAVLDALASVERMDDIAAVRSAVRTVYRPWLEAVVKEFQEAVASTADAYETATPSQVSEGTCLLFVDGLRFDLAQRLRLLLDEQGVKGEIEAHLTALPSVTATAKPATSPAAEALAAGDGFGTVVKSTGSRVTADVLRRLVGNSGFQVLGEEDFGDPTGRAWSESGDIDAYGHEQGWRLAHHVAGELRRLADRVANLLGHGWQRVVLVTDHGWLLMPGDLPKAELPEHLTELRKGRCARLKVGSQTDHQLVSWHWDPSIRIAMAPGIHCYEAGKEYEHGGLSPQECVVPVLTAIGRAPRLNVSIDEVKWRRLRCTVAVRGAVPGARLDIRTKGGDPSTTLTMGGKELDPDGEASLLVEDEDREDEAAVIVVVGSDGAVLAQTSTIVGGS